MSRGNDSWTVTIFFLNNKSSITFAVCKLHEPCLFFQSNIEWSLELEPLKVDVLNGIKRRE